MAKRSGDVFEINLRGIFFRTASSFCVTHQKKITSCHHSILRYNQQLLKENLSSEAAPIHESCLRLAFLLKARRSAGRWWSSDKADWKSVVVTWSGRRLCPLHCMNRLLLKRNIIPRTNIALSLRTRQRSSLWEISKR